jgi:hypothetical protein
MALMPFTRQPSHIVNLCTTVEVSGLFRFADALFSGKESPSPQYAFHVRLEGLIL